MTISTRALCKECILYYFPFRPNSWLSFQRLCRLLPILLIRREGGSVAEWLACWTQAQKGLGSNRSRDALG